MRRILLSHAAWIVGLLVTTPVLAQTAAGGSAEAPTASLSEVIVTAQRRDERLQNVPIAVTAVSEAQLTRAHIQNTQDLAQIAPGLTFPSDVGYALPHIRGVGNSAVAPGNENSVALYVDGVYYAAAAGSILTLNNVASVEVLKGPQGTLFGRNATGGLIQVITKDPSQTPQAEANVSYGNYNTSSIDFYGTRGLSDSLAVSVALQATHQGQGWGKNLATGQDIYKLDSDLSARVKVRWTPSPRTQVVLSADYASARDSRYALAEAAGTAAANPFYPPAVITTRPYDVRQDLTPASRLEAGGASVKITQDVEFADLISITAFRSQKFYFTVDFDLGPQPFIGDVVHQADRQFSQELQLQSQLSGPLRWTAGLYYFHARSGYDPQILTFVGPAAQPVGPGLSLTGLNNDATQSTDSIAGYVQATYEFLENWRITGGFRETHETRKFNADETGTFNDAFTAPLLVGLHQEFTIRKPTGRVAIDHNFAPDILGYISYNHGFKSGGFNPGDPTSAPYQTEALNAYEVGLKTQLLDRRLRINTAAFYYDYSNIQVSRFMAGVPSVYNGAGAKIYGADIDLDVAASEHLLISGGLEALHSEFKSFPCADYFVGGPNLSSPACPSVGPTLPYLRSAVGNRLPMTPNFSASLTIDYHRPLWGGTGAVAVTDSYTGSFFWEPNNTLKQPAYHLLNATMSWTSPDQRRVIRLWAKNINDVRYSTEVASAPTGVAQAYAPPRTYGFTLGLKY